MNVSELKELWQLSFGDSADYVDFYFNRRYSAKNTRCISSDGRIVSSAQFFPYNISYGKSLINSIYILGVCTHPDYRRRGYVSRLIQEILTKQAAIGTELAFLIPSEQDLFAVYEKFGFGGLFTVYERYVESVSCSGMYELLKPTIDMVFDFYSRFYKSLNSAVLKTRDDFQFMVEDIAASRGHILVCGKDGELRGFAAIEENVIKELLCVDDTARDTLMSAFLSEEGNGLKVITPNPQPHADKKTIGLARVLRPGAFLAKTMRKNCVIQLTDSLIPKNNGIYTVENGRVEYSPSGEYEISRDISELPALAMNESYANLLLN